ncbi:hypothetical protein C6497_05095 [Candidatus Poribacteria bacterium]|nr:MAG: hypothetical protein C6497_05095 [Candidatus Poribacteria bacterium]
MFYPAYINLQNRKCLVIGGGVVAERKVVSMLVSGGNVTLISPNATELVIHLAKLGAICWLKRDFNTGDTEGFYLVCAATDETDVNTSVYTEAVEKFNIRLVNVVDVIPQCTFAAASVVSDGEIMISISTSGMSPATSRRIREYFERTLNASSLYTLGYVNDKPTPIKNQNLPYPVYFLLENRKCIVIYDEMSEELIQKVNLLVNCGANIDRIRSEDAEELDFEDTFLVLTTDDNFVNSDYIEEFGFIIENISNPLNGSFYTPNIVFDDNLIISISTNNCIQTDKSIDLFDIISKQFTNNGYGRFIEFLGKIRPTVLNRFSSSKERADFFDNLIDFVDLNNDFEKNKDQIIEQNEQKTIKCCLRLTDRNCTYSCLFNWICHGKTQHATDLVESFLLSRIN